MADFHATNWQSHRVEFKQGTRADEFPSLAEAANESKKHRGKHRRRTGAAAAGAAHAAPIPALSLQPNVWEQRAREQEEVRTTKAETETKEEPEEEDQFGLVYQVELRMVLPRYVDEYTASTRYFPYGCVQMARLFASLVKDDASLVDTSAAFRTLRLSCTPYAPGSTLGKPPNPAAAAKFAAKLPDGELSEEFRLLSKLRSLSVPLGPRAIDRLLSQAAYLNVKKRILPRIRRPLTPPPSPPSPPSTVISARVERVCTPLPVEDSSRLRETRRQQAPPLVRHSSGESAVSRVHPQKTVSDDVRSCLSTVSSNGRNGYHNQQQSNSHQQQSQNNHHQQEARNGRDSPKPSFTREFTNSRYQSPHWENRRTHNNDSRSQRDEGDQECRAPSSSSHQHRNGSSRMSSYDGDDDYDYRSSDGGEGYRIRSPQNQWKWMQYDNRPNTNNDYDGYDRRDYHEQEEEYNRWNEQDEEEEYDRSQEYESRRKESNREHEDSYYREPHWSKGCMVERRCDAQFNHHEEKEYDRGRRREEENDRWIQDVRRKMREEEEIERRRREEEEEVERRRREEEEEAQRAREQERRPKRPTPAVIRMTRTGKRAPQWIVQDDEEIGEMMREPKFWDVRLSYDRPVEVREEEEDEEWTREKDLDSREPFATELKTDERRLVRCLRGVPCNSQMAVADDGHHVELTTWEGETDAAAVRERVMEKYGLEKMEREARDETAIVALPNSSISFLIGAGGEADILFGGECCQLLMKGRWDEIRDQVREEDVVRTRDLSLLGEKNDGIPILNPYCVVTYATSDAAAEARSAHFENLDARNLPRALMPGSWNGTHMKRECWMEVEWERNCTTGFKVKLLDPTQKQQDLFDRVMREASLHFQSANVKHDSEYSKYVSLPWDSPYQVADEHRFLEELLRENGVMCTVRTCWSRDKQSLVGKSSDVRTAVNRKMLRMAMEQNVWPGFHPSSKPEWDMMLAENRFPWEVEVIEDDKKPDYNALTAPRNRAVIRFDAFEQGERIAAHGQRLSPNVKGELGFTMNALDRKGVYVRSVLRYHFNVPLCIHSLVFERLQMMDNEWRANSLFSHAKFNSDEEPFMRWCRLQLEQVDEAITPGFCRLIVEGFPKGAVDDACEDLMKVLKGDVMECGEGTDEEWLLTGIGRTMADEVAAKALEKQSVIVDFNVIGREIRLIGNRDKTMEVENELRTIAEMRQKHRLSTRITISQPVYMQRIVAAIGACGGLPMVEAVVGECKLSACPEDVDNNTIIYEGTVGGYERLREYLVEVDELFRESARAALGKDREAAALSPLCTPPVCPVCRCRPAADFYRLESCGHVYCSHCIHFQIGSELAARTFPLACHAAGCSQPLAVSDLMRLLMGGGGEGVRRAPHLEELKLRPLVRAIVDRVLQTRKDQVIPCRTADCSGIFRRLSSTSVHKLLLCRSCKHTMCGACGNEPHEGNSCEEYQKLRDSVDFSLSTWARDKRLRRCPNPNCAAVIEKAEGCNHMECALCRTHFCWLCNSSSADMGGIYAHMQEVHGGNGLHMQEGELFMLQFAD